jgi:hypothetical protein
VTLLATDRVVETALVEVLLRNVMPAIKGTARHGCIYAIEHHVILHIGALFNPGTASLGVWTFDDQLVEHGGNDLGHGARVCVLGAAGRALFLRLRPRLLLMGLLCFPSMETLATENVIALELDWVGKGTVADKADLVVDQLVSRWPRAELISTKPTRFESGVDTYWSNDRSGASLVPVCFRLESMLARICSGLGEAGGPPTGEV